MPYETIIVEAHGRVGLIRFNRPKALNAINSQLIQELARAIAVFEQDANIGCLLIAGSDKAFAAGADIKELADKTFVDALKRFQDASALHLMVVLAYDPLFARDIEI